MLGHRLPIKKLWVPSIRSRDPLALWNRFTEQKRSHITEALHRAPPRRSDRPSQQTEPTNRRTPPAHWSTDGLGYRKNVAKDDGYYTAWDGSRYLGPPPDGWFLAADNRWWPAPEAETPGPRHVEDEGPTPAPQTPSSSAPPDEPVGNGNPAATPPPTSWAPLPNERRRAGSEPGRPPYRPAGTGQSNRSGSTRPGRSAAGGRPSLLGRVGVLRRFLPIVFFFVLFRGCDAFDQEPTLNLDRFGENANLVPADTADFSLRSGCGQGFAWASITNETNTNRNFVARTERVDRSDEDYSRIATIAPGEEANVTISFSPQGERLDLCPSVVIYEVTTG